MMKFRFHLALIILLTIALAGCGQSARSLNHPDSEADSGNLIPKDTQASAPVPTTIAPQPSPTSIPMHGTISIRHSWSEAELPALVQIIDTFRSQHPEVYFDVLYIPAQDLRMRYEVETREGRGADILLGPAEWAQELFVAGLVADLSSWPGSEQREALIQPALDAFRLNHALAGIPYAVQGVVLYRNKDIITISPPTLNDLVNLAATSTRGEVLGASLERSVFYSTAHLVGMGGQLMDDHHIPAFNSPAGLVWIETLRRFEDAGPPAYLSDEDLTAFEEGRVGWIIDGTWNLRTLAAAIGPENLAIDPWPQVDQGRLAGYIIPDGLYASPNIPADRLPAVQTFILHFISPEAQAILADEGRIPAVQGTKLPDRVTSPLIKQAIVALTGNIPYPYSPEMELYSQQLDLALRLIFEDDLPPEVALQAAADAIRSALAAPTPTP